MNKNPLLIKSALTDKIPFIKEKTQALYSKYLSQGKLSKILTSSPNDTETLTAYTLGSSYKINFIFDQVDITPETYFSEKEWIALGMLLRAYKEIEGINLMHLYNCFYRGENNIIYGHVVTGRKYSLYAASQLNCKIRIYLENGPVEISKHSLSYNKPFIIEVPSQAVESLVEIQLEFTGTTYYKASLFEGIYSGIRLRTLGNSFLEKNLIPELVQPGEYSSKLVEFFAGNLITKLSNIKLRESITRELKAKGTTPEEITLNMTPGWHNKDGYMDRRIDI